MVRFFGRLSQVAFILFFCISSAYANPAQLKYRDIRQTMDEMFRYHVEYKELNPLIVKRSLKSYIDMFDIEKTYLLDSEVRPYLDISSSKIDGVIQGYRKDNYSNFLDLNTAIQKAITRSRGWRSEVERELILRVSSEDGIPVVGESYLQFTSSQDALKARLKKQLLRLLQAEMKQKDLASTTPQQREKAFALWEKRFQRLENSYVQQGDKGEHYFTLHLLKAMARSLDAHTTYFSPEEAFEMRASLEKQFEGIGVLLKETVDGVVVADLIKGGPAEKSGQVKIGDVIQEIDGKSLNGIAYDEVLDAMKGNGSKRITLLLKTSDGKGKEYPRKVELIREKIVMQDDRLQFSSEPFGKGLIGKLVLPSFYESAEDSSCESDIKLAIKQLKAQGDLLGIVLDMRENSGGFLNQAVKVAGLFISSGVIVISKYAEGEVQYLRDVDGRVYFNGPLLILTSKASASAAEIVAQSLQDYGAALVVGDERTYGKGTIQYQTVTDSDATAFFKVTVGRYYTVSGRSTQIEGVLADIIVPTEFASYNIGERFLEYPLKGDRVASVYVDPLTDLDQNSKRWFQKNYLPNLQKKESTWRKMLPLLTNNSSYRLKANKNYQLFMKNVESQEGEIVDTNWGQEDLQMTETVNILKDMILLQTAPQETQ